MYRKKIFKNAVCKIPMNIQMYAESAGDDSGGGSQNYGVGSDLETKKTENAEEKKEDTPSIEELMTQLANERAEKVRTKNALDNALKENGEVKKQLRSKMTAEEQLDAAKKEQEEAKDALIAEYQAKEKIRDCTEFLMDSNIGMDKKTAKEFAQKFVEGNFDDAMPILEKHIKAIKDDAYQQALSSRSDVKAGNGDVDENSSAMEMAAAYASRKNGVNMDILNQY